MKNKLRRFENTELIDFVKLSADGVEKVLAMRNHPEVKKWMYSHNDISMGEHLAFVDSLKRDSTRRYFVLEGGGVFIGVLYFMNMSSIDSVSEFGLYANPFENLLGAGRILEETAITYAFKTLKLKQLKLEVYSGNQKVINLHMKYGFKKVGNDFVQGREIILMALDRENNE